MNISLSKEKTKKKLGFGLINPNNNDDNKPATNNVFGGDNDSEEEEEMGDDDRAAVNRDLRAEQEALRKRAAASLETAAYDYDGVYDEMHTAPSKPKEPLEKKSRYIGDLLKAAKQRERERDVIHERKVAKEQAQEEAEYRGKDKFVTKAYKKKLAERELWAQEEEAKRREEEKEDVTKKTDGAFAASFYGGLNRNVAMGGGEEREAEKESKTEEIDQGQSRYNEEGDQTRAGQQKPAGLGFTDGFESAVADDAQAQDEPKSEAILTAASPISMRKAREEKIAKARLRYFQRQGISDETAAAQRQ